MEIRRWLYERLRKLWGLSEGERAPKSLLPFCFILFPIRFFLQWQFGPWCKYDREKRALLVDGTWLSLCFLGDIANCPPNYLFRIVKKENQHLVMERFFFEDLEKDTTYEIEFKNGLLYRIRRKYERHTASTD